MVGSVLAAVVGYYASTAVAAVIGAGIISAVVGGLASSVFKAVFTDKPEQQQPLTQELRDNLVTIRQPISNWQYLYGRSRVGGALTFAHESADGNFHLVITYAGHVCQEIEQVWFNDEVVPLDVSGNATGKYAGYVRIKMSLGAEAGQPFADLVSEGEGTWTDAHRQTGRTKLYVRLTPSADLFPQGIPNITAIIKGKKVYDPRTATTIWTDNASLCQADFLLDEPAGLAAVYATEIDETQLIAAANLDDEAVLLATSYATFTADAATDAITFAVGAVVRMGDGIQLTTTGTLPAGLSVATTYYIFIASGGAIKLATSLANARAGTAVNITGAGTGTHTGTRYSEPRYTCNGTFDVNTTPREVLGRLLTANDGRCVYIGGMFRIHPAAYVSPTITLTEDDCRAVPHIIPRLSGADLCNRVKGIYVSEANLWQPSDFPPITNATYLAEDEDEPSWRELDLPYTKSPSMCQRIAKIELERTRQQISVEWPGKLSCYRLQACDTAGLTFGMMGWTAKVFEITSSGLAIEPDGDGNIRLGSDLVLRETASGVFDWNSGEETQVDLAPDTNLPSPFYVAPPSNLDFSEGIFLQDLSGELTWDASPSSWIAYYQAEWKRAADVTYTVMEPINALTQHITGLRTGSHNFRVKAVNTLGVSSGYATATETLAGDVPLLTTIGLTTPTSASIFAAADRNGFVGRGRLRLGVDESDGNRPDFVVVCYAVDSNPRTMTIDADDGTNLHIAAVNILAYAIPGVGTQHDILAGSTTSRLVIRTATNPIPANVNYHGMYWGQFTTSKWRKATGHNDTTVEFRPPFDVTPVAGDKLNWSEITWFDERDPEWRLGFLYNDAGDYEVVKWDVIDQTATDFYVVLSDRAQEGTTQIDGSGTTFGYYPAPGAGTEMFVLPLSAMVDQGGGIYEGAMDLNLSMKPDNWVAMTVMTFKITSTGIVRSNLIPLAYGGVL